MNVGIIGFGNQGAKRFKLLKKDVKFIFDQNKNVTHFNKIEDLPLDKVSAVFLCVPDNIKSNCFSTSLICSSKFIYLSIIIDKIILHNSCSITNNSND